MRISNKTNRFSVLRRSLIVTLIASFMLLSLFSIAILSAGASFNIGSTLVDMNLDTHGDGDGDGNRPPAVDPFGDGDGDGNDEGNSNDDPPAFVEIPVYIIDEDDPNKDPEHGGDGDGEDPQNPDGDEDQEEETNDEENIEDENKINDDESSEDENDDVDNDNSEEEEHEEETIEDIEEEEDYTEDEFKIGDIPTDIPEDDLFIITINIDGLEFLLIDMDKDGMIDICYNPETGITSIVEETDDGKIRVDINNDGIWDYIYDPVLGEVRIISSNENTSNSDATAFSQLLPFYIMLMVGSIVAGIIGYWIYHDQKKLSIKEKDYKKDNIFY